MVDYVDLTWVHSCEVFGGLLYGLCRPAVQNLRVGWQACRSGTAPFACRWLLQHRLVCSMPHPMVLGLPVCLRCCLGELQQLVLALVQPAFDAWAQCFWKQLPSSSPAVVPLVRAALCSGF